VRSDISAYTSSVSLPTKGDRLATRRTDASGSAKREATSVVQNERLIIWVGAVVVLAVVALTGYVVTRLAAAQPAVAAGVLTAVAAVLAVIPAIIRSLRGR
jgi:hypothetical protein